MRVSRGVLALFAVVCILCTTCGCLGISPPPSGGSITAVELPGSPEAYTLSGALAELDLLGAEGGLNVTGTSIHQVIGSGVDLDGRATSWVLGLQDGEKVRWLTFGFMSWQEISLRAPLPDSATNMTEILSPEELLSADEGAIRPVMERLGADTVDISLAEGIYSITVHSSAGMETLTFRADTGEVVA